MHAVKLRLQLCQFPKGSNRRITAGHAAPLCVQVVCLRARECAGVSVRVCVCERACVRACVRARARAHVHVLCVCACVSCACVCTCARVRVRARSVCVPVAEQARPSKQIAAHDRKTAWAAQPLAHVCAGTCELV